MGDSAREPRSLANRTAIVTGGASGIGYIDTPLLKNLPDERASFVEGAYFPVDGEYLAR